MISIPILRKSYSSRDGNFLDILFLLVSLIMYPEKFRRSKSPFFFSFFKIKSRDWSFIGPRDGVMGSKGHKIGHERLIR